MLVLLTARLRCSPQGSWRCLMSLGEGTRCRWAPIKVVKLGAPPAGAQASPFAAQCPMTCDGSTSAGHRIRQNPGFSRAFLKWCVFFEFYRDTLGGGGGAEPTVVNFMMPQAHYTRS